MECCSLSREHLGQGVVDIAHLFQRGKLGKLGYERGIVHGLGWILLLQLRGKQLQEIVLAESGGIVLAGCLLLGGCRCALNLRNR